MISEAILKHFPVPDYLNMSSVGFEITPEAVTFLELKKESGEYRVGRYGTYPVPKKEVDEENFPSGEALVSFVSGIKNKHNLSLISAALPEEKAYIFKTEVPKAGREEIRDGLELRLEEFVPIPPKEAVFDFQILRDISDEKLSVSVTVVPHLIVKRYQDFFASAGLTPVSFQIGAQSITNSVFEKSDTAPAIVVNMGKEKTGLYLVSERAVHFTSTVQVGGASLIEAIKKNFNVTAKEAEKIKAEGINSGKSTELFSSLISSLSIIRDEVEKLTGYWETHLERYSEAKQKINRLVLCGSESGLEGMTDYFESSLAMHTELANVWVNSISFEKYIPPISRKDSLAYATVIGLSLDNL